MLIAVSMATVCILGVAFYARFLFAMYKECRHQRSARLRMTTYWTDPLLEPPNLQSHRFRSGMKTNLTNRVLRLRIVTGSLEVQPRDDWHGHIYVSPHDQGLLGE